MAFLAAALPYIAAAGTVISTVQQAGAAKAAGQAQQQAADFAAGQAEQQAGQARAASQRRAIEERRRGRLAASRAQAVGAASGSAGSVDVINRIADLEAQGEYGALVALYEGEEQARGLETQAGVSRFEGGQARTAGNLAAQSAIVSGASSLAAKYGGGLAGGAQGGSVNLQGQSTPLYNNPAFVRNM